MCWLWPTISQIRNLVVGTISNHSSHRHAILQPDSLWLKDHGPLPRLIKVWACTYRVISSCLVLTKSDVSYLGYTLLRQNSFKDISVLYLISFVVSSEEVLYYLAKLTTVIALWYLKVVPGGYHRYFFGVKVKTVKLIGGTKFLSARSGLNVRTP